MLSNALDVVILSEALKVAILSNELDAVILSNALDVVILSEAKNPRISPLLLLVLQSPCADNPPVRRIIMSQTLDFGH